LWLPEDLLAQYVSQAPPLEAQFETESWRAASKVAIARLWQGDEPPDGLKTTARLLWTDDELVVGFECSYVELDADSECDPSVERYALWDRDVCEIFVRSPGEPAETSYKEFEVAPTGQWCDLKIDRATRVHDWEWKSGMRAFGRIDHGNLRWRAVMALPFSAFGERPRRGDAWWGNLFRVARIGDERIYLAYSPNTSERPNFHVPESFVRIRFG
jgi:hypothetical protein